MKEEKKQNTTKKTNEKIYKITESEKNKTGDTK